MNKIFNYTGVFLNIPAITLNVKAWLLQEHVNFILTVFISLLAMIWWGMKIYHQYLQTRKYKKDIGE